MSYLGAARSISTGRGVRVPFAAFDDADSTGQLRDYPPGFPALIAAAAPYGAFEQGGRRIAVLGAALLAGGIALLVAPGAGIVAGLLGALAFLATPSFLGDYSIVLSEGPFLPVLVTVLGLLGLEEPPVLLVGLACAAGVMLRYVGLFLALGAGASLLLRPGTMRQRLQRAALGAGPAFVTFLVWNHLAGGARSYQWNPGFLATLWEGVGTVSLWLAPWFLAMLPRLVLALAMLALLARLAARPAGVSPQRGSAVRLRLAAAILAACFLVMMTFSRLLADSAIIFDDRLLSPLLVLGIIAAASLVGERWSSWPRNARFVAGTIAALWLGGTALRSRPLVRDLLDDGWGFASRDWQGSDLARWLRADGTRYAIFSDNAPATYSLTRRPSRELPPVADSATAAAVGAALAAGPSALVGYADQFNPGESRGADFARQLGWHIALQADEGTVWLPGGVAPR